LGKNNLNIKATNKEKSIPKRSNQAMEDLLDLSEYYTASLDDDLLTKPGNNLKSLPKGIQAFAKASFDVRGLILLSGKKIGEETGTGLDFPEAVKGIKVNFQGTKIHLLHGTSGVVKENTRIGQYILNYTDGQIKNIPIVYGRNIRDWWIKKGDPIPTDASIAWTGENEASRKSGYDVQLYRYSVNNPLPDIELKTIDFVSELTASAPFLVAVTVEPRSTVYEYFDSLSVYNDIIPRSEKAGPDQVDLTNYYNASLDDDWHQHAGHDIHDLPKGLQNFGGINFDTRGIIQLAGGFLSLKRTGLALPEELLGIKVNRKGRLVHFLPCCGWPAEPGTKIGAYILHYANGETKEAPILYGKNVVDWWTNPEEEQFKGEEADQVWVGSNAATRRSGRKTQLIKYAWKNPLPNVEITSIDFISAVANFSGPFLIAITIEP
jgi:hypothetical protein